MPEASDVRGIFRQNLEDAGCGPETVRRCMALAQEGECAGLMRILARHRQALLDEVHRNERRIDCLDYLVYAIEKRHYKI